ncbi:n-alpha-acetyltransferase 50 [Anaeramoeba ignava]|uniref:N-alpha-acetyltransferase 60 n=1 Tax=Anaeramoeba ignava TaxID=1746090 RepID=A0A9Q0L8W9_ANAIG|nr:n-alpha-acetyltransferase 50 [Anaeramoeba ignava]
MNSNYNSNFKKTLFPYEYPDSHYQKLFEEGFYSQIALDPNSTKVIGEITAKIEPNFSGCLTKPHQSAYILTFGVAEEMRRKGIGTELFQRLLSEIRQHEKIEEVTLHVNCQNESAIGLYRKLGFSIDTKIHNYYQYHGKYHDAYWMIYEISCGEKEKKEKNKKSFSGFCQNVKMCCGSIYNTYKLFF